MSKKFPFNPKILENMKHIWRLSHTQFINYKMALTKEAVRTKVEETNAFYKTITGLARIEASQEEIKQLEETQEEQKRQYNFIRNMINETKSRLMNIQADLKRLDGRTSPNKYVEILAKEKKITEELQLLHDRLKSEEQKERNTFTALQKAERHSSKYQKIRTEHLYYLRYFGGAVGLLISAFFFNQTGELIKAIRRVEAKVEELKRPEEEKQVSSYWSYVTYGTSKTWGGFKWAVTSPYNYTKKMIWGESPKKEWWRKW